MIRLIGRRVLFSALIVWLVTTVVFLATQALPGDAAKALLGREATPDRLAQLQRQLGTDQPMWNQYTSWFTKLLRADFGNSLSNGESVLKFLTPLIFNSLVLMLIAALLSSVVALILGIATAAKRDSKLDHATTVTTLILAAVPEFVVGVALTWLFSTGVFHFLPAVYMGSPTDPVWKSPNQLVLPILTLVIAVAPYLTRMMRATTLEVLETEYVQHARLKGLPERIVLMRHALPNAVSPVIQVLALQFAWLVGGVIIVEYLFNFPGVGTALVNSVTARDLPITQALAVFFSVFYVFVNLVADISALLLNPRARTAR